MASTFASTGAILGTSATFTSTLGKSTLALLDTFFFTSVFFFLASIPPLEVSFTGSGTMGMIGVFATSFTGAGC